MKISHYVDERKMVIKFNSELDHHEIESIRRRVDYDIQRFMPRKVLFDFSNVVFMDSAGIGFLIGRYKIVTAYGGQVEITNINEKIKRIFEMSGIFKIVNLVENSKVSAQN